MKGACLAVSAAIVYMASLEEPLLTSTHLEFYRRFIDDIFYNIWSDNLPASTFPGISLDMIICKDRDFPTKLITKLYQKPLNRYLYIPYHPK